MVDKKKVRVRFAPSPTGPLHIGSARTALFNWIFAKANGGDFILRIEDTDKERSKDEFEEDIKKSLKWLGIEWDEYLKQSDRTEIYKEYLEKLLEDQKAYWCFCSKEELEAERQAMVSQGLASKYSGTCRNLDEDEAEERLEKGESAVIRLKIPDVKISFKDMVRGEITFDGALLGDVIIAKDLESPLYNFVVIIDDVLGEITHVIRGEDHISNTPKQVFLMKVLGFEIPQFAHLPIILNQDRSKMSKRFSDTALSDYIVQGYTREAMFNFLSFLGWHPKDDKDVMSEKEIIKEFDMARVQKGGAAFNQEKLDWLNNQYLKDMKFTQFKEYANGFVPNDWKLTATMIDTIRGRINKLNELEELLGFYFDLPSYSGELLRWKEMNMNSVEESLSEMKNMIDKIPARDFDLVKLEKKILPDIDKESRGEMLWPLRVALSGQKASPSPFEIMGVLGKEEALSRINIALEKIAIPEQTY